MAKDNLAINNSCTAVCLHVERLFKRAADFNAMMDEGRWRSDLSQEAGLAIEQVKMAAGLHPFSQPRAAALGLRAELTSTQKRLYLERLTQAINHYVNSHDVMPKAFLAELVAVLLKCDQCSVKNDEYLSFLQGALRTQKDDPVALRTALRKSHNIRSLPGSTPA